jgi:glycosyltransferase involved in cell wall biosynthesis
VASVRDLLPPALRKALSGVKRRTFPYLARVKRALVDTLAAIRHGLAALPASFVAGRAEDAITVPGSSFVFPHGLQTGRSRFGVLAWNVTHHRYLVLVVVEADGDPALAAWARRAQRLLGATLLLQGITDGAEPASRLEGGPELLRRELIRLFPRHDALIIDAREPLPSLLSLVYLKFAALGFWRGKRIGVAVPARQDADGERRLGVDYDRSSDSWRDVRLADLRSYGQESVPRFVLTDRAHGAYLRREFIAEAPAPLHPVDWDDLVTHWIAEGWRGGRRTVLYPAAVLPTHREYHVPARLAAGWQSAREVIGPDGRVRVIFVLQATSLSGGIRAVLELADALAKQDFDVQVWSLQGQPTWTEIDLRVVRFRTYDALIDALAPEQAIKVATWWETAHAVWLASVDAGLPLQYVQEFETWFYPEQVEGRASVAASYRNEFSYVTTAQFQLQELAEVGISATLIPPAYDAKVFRVRTDVSRQDATVLALGRSFFQKNFAMTLAGWRSLGDRRPQLELFGFEPGIARDPRIRYHYLPSDDEVARLYNSATCFVQTSLHEGFSLPIIEAMASGCPVITTDSHGNRFCVDEENCLMVEQGDADGLGRAIQRLIADPDLQERLRRGGLETAARFRWEEVVAQTAAHYRRLAGAGGSGAEAR